MKNVRTIGLICVLVAVAVSMGLINFDSVEAKTKYKLIKTIEQYQVGEKEAFLKYVYKYNKKKDPVKITMYQPGDKKRRWEKESEEKNKFWYKNGKKVKANISGWNCKYDKYGRRITLYSYACVYKKGFIVKTLRENNNTEATYKVTKYKNGNPKKIRRIDWIYDDDYYGGNKSLPEDTKMYNNYATFYKNGFMKKSAGLVYGKGKILKFKYKFKKGKIIQVKVTDNYNPTTIYKIKYNKMNISKKRYINMINGELINVNSAQDVGILWY